MKAFTFICGGDDFLVTRLGRSIYAERTSAIEDDFAKEVVAGDAAKVEEVERAVREFRDAVRTLPLFGDRKVVWFKDVNFLADSVTGRAEGTLAQVALLKSTLAQVDPATVDVIITASPVDRRRSFPKWCEKTGDFRLASDDKKKAEALRVLVGEECARLGVTLAPGVAEVLVAKLNGNTRLVIGEIGKLATYLGDEGSEITETLVAELVPNFGEGDFFETAEAFDAGDLPWALDAVRRHFFTNKDSRGILTTLQNRNRLAIQLRVLIDAGELQVGGRGIPKGQLDAAARTYGRHFGEGEPVKSNTNIFTQNPWYLGRIAGPAQRHPLKSLIRFQAEFLRAFEEVLARPNEQEQVMRELVIRCLA